MKILCVIDHFGSGGAQRQMVTLACGLKERGHTVEMFIYFPQYDFFRSRIDDCQIPVHEYKKGKGFSLGVLRKLSTLMGKGSYDIVLSYLSSPNVYAELASLISRDPRVIVSERSSHFGDKSFVGAYLRRLIHVFSTHLVTNSRAHANWLQEKIWINGKVSFIYNGLDLDSFASDPLIPDSCHDLRLLSIGRVGPEKNVKKLIMALQIYYEKCGYVPEVSWVGRRDTSPAGITYCQQVDDLLDSFPEVQNSWNWLGERSDVPLLLSQHHALIHPSFYEGLPNAVCEALASGKPVLVSNVCDHPLLVADSERGFLFDPNNPGNIAHAIRKLAELDTEGWYELSSNSLNYAKENLGIERMVKTYERLFYKLVEGRAGVCAG